MTDQDTATECTRIANALKDMEAKAFKGRRVSLTEIMAIHTTPPATVLFDERDLEPRQYGALEQ